NRRQSGERSINFSVDGILPKLLAIGSLHAQRGVPSVCTQAELANSGFPSLSDDAKHFGEDLIIGFEDILANGEILEVGGNEVNQGPPSPTDCRPDDEE